MAAGLLKSRSFPESWFTEILVTKPLQKQNLSGNYGEAKMNIAKEYFKNQFGSEEFMRSFLEEKVKLDIEYRLEELKKDIQTHKSPEELIEKLNSTIEQFVMSV